MKKKQFLAILIFTTIATQGALAKDYGVHGATYEIKEEGFLAMIHRKLKTVDMQLQQKKMQETARGQVEEPKPNPLIKRTKKEQSFTYDPTYIVEKDIFLPGGKLLYKSGTLVNPFDHIALEKKLIFIDSRDRKQVEWFKAQKINQLIKEQDKLILVAGRPFDLEAELNREVYFDQGATLTTKFNIEQVPAIVEQEDKLLRVREVYIDENFK